MNTFICFKNILFKDLITEMNGFLDEHGQQSKFMCDM